MLDRLLVDWPLKLIALVVAFGIWVSITGEDHTLKDFTVPVEIQLRDDRIAAAPPPTTVTVRLDGTETAIRKLDPLRLAVRLDLRDFPMGEREVQLSEAHLDGVPQGVKVSFFEPDRLSLTVDRRVQRELPVSAEFSGELPDGYAFYRVRIRPETALVEGPEAAVNAITELRTDAIPTGRRTRSFVEYVGAVPDVPQVRVVDPRPFEVHAVVDFAPTEMTFDAVAVVFEGRELPMRAEPRSLRIKVSGPPELLDRLRPEQIRAVADVTGLEPRDRDYRVPVEAELVDLDPEALWRLRIETVTPALVSVAVAPAGGEAS